MDEPEIIANQQHNSLISINWVDLMVFRRDLMDRSVELAGITSAWGDPLLPALNKNFDNVTTPRADVFHTITQQEFGSILNPTTLIHLQLIWMKLFLC